LNFEYTPEPLELINLAIRNGDLPLHYNSDRYRHRWEDKRNGADEIALVSMIGRLDSGTLQIVVLVVHLYPECNHVSSLSESWD